MSLSVFHAADLHYCPKHLDEVDRAFGAAVDEAIARECDVAIIAGDSLDSSMGIHEPAVGAWIGRVRRLADAMPVCVLQGTYSHDRPGSIDLLNELGMLTKHPVWVATWPERMALIRTTNGPGWDDIIDPDDFDESRVLAYVCVLPSLNKADPVIMEQGAARWTRRTLERWTLPNTYARSCKIPTLLVTHGTVNGSLTESNFAMVSPDHEFDLDVLRSAECDAVMLGHIHKHQSWIERTPSDARCRIAYPGSIAHLTYGQTEPCGWLHWTIDAGRADFEFVEIPGRRLVDISFDGPPNLDELAAMSAEVTANDRVRIRWHIDQEHAHSIDKDALRQMFGHAVAIKLEGTVNPIQSVRAGGIGKAHTLEGRLALWAKTTGDSDRVSAMSDRLEILRSFDPEHIAARLIENIDGKSDEQ